MTFCIGIKVREGLIALADTKIVKGDERLTRAKLSTTSLNGNHWWLMTSGLRSVRDKTVTYLDQQLESQNQSVERVFELANAFGTHLRNVRQEDGPALAASNFTFNLHGIIGGQLSSDFEPRMYYIYPEGNWIESSDDSPYFVIGRTHYAKPILDRLLTSEVSLAKATALAFLAFDATRASVTDVGYPIDLIVIHANTRVMSKRRFEAAELGELSNWWHQTLSTALDNFPTQHFNSLLNSYE